MNLSARNSRAHKPIDIKFYRVAHDTEDDRPRPRAYAPAFRGRTATPDMMP